MREKAETLSRDTIEYLEAVSSLVGCAISTLLVFYEAFYSSQFICFKLRLAGGSAHDLMPTAAVTA